MTVNGDRIIQKLCFRSARARPGQKSEPNMFHQNKDGPFPDLQQAQVEPDLNFIIHGDFFKPW